MIGRFLNAAIEAADKTGCRFSFRLWYDRNSKNLNRWTYTPMRPSGYMPGSILVFTDTTDPDKADRMVYFDGVRMTYTCDRLSKKSKGFIIETDKKYGLVRSFKLLTSRVGKDDDRLEILNSALHVLTEEK